MSETQTDINLQDLVQIKRILEVVSNRGAIHANEMSTVGAIYNKIHNVLKKVEDGENENGNGSIHLTP